MYRDVSRDYRPLNHLAAATLPTFPLFICTNALARPPRQATTSTRMYALCSTIYLSISLSGSIARRHRLLLSPASGSSASITRCCLGRGTRYLRTHCARTRLHRSDDLLRAFYGKDKKTFVRDSSDLNPPLSSAIGKQPTCSEMYLTKFNKDSRIIGRFSCFFMFFHVYQFHFDPSLSSSISRKVQRRA